MFCYRLMLRLHGQRQQKSAALLVYKLIARIADLLVVLVLNFSRPLLIRQYDHNDGASGSQTVDRKSVV